MDTPRYAELLLRAAEDEAHRESIVRFVAELARLSKEEG